MNFMTRIITMIIMLPITTRDMISPEPLEQGEALVQLATLRGTKYKIQGMVTITEGTHPVKVIEIVDIGMATTQIGVQAETGGEGQGPTGLTNLAMGSIHEGAARRFHAWGSLR